MRHLRSLGFAQRSMESMILHEIEQMCKALTTNQPIDLTRKTNLAVVNCLWLIIAGQRYHLNDQRLLSLIQNLENILKSSKMISLTALLCPTLYARFHPRFQEAKSMFDDFKQMMRLAIDQHLVSIVQGVPTSFRWEVLVKISNLREIRILKFFVKKIRQIEVRSALFS